MAVRVRSGAAAGGGGELTWEEAQRLARRMEKELFAREELGPAPENVGVEVLVCADTPGVGMPSIDPHDGRVKESGVEGLERVCVRVYSDVVRVILYGAGGTANRLSSLDEALMILDHLERRAGALQRLGAELERVEERLEGLARELERLARELGAEPPPRPLPPGRGGGPAGGEHLWRFMERVARVQRLLEAIEELLCTKVQLMRPQSITIRPRFRYEIEIAEGGRLPMILNGELVENPRLEYERVDVEFDDEGVFLIAFYIPQSFPTLLEWSLAKGIALEDVLVLLHLERRHGLLTRLLERVKREVEKQKRPMEVYASVYEAAALMGALEPW